MATKKSQITLAEVEGWGGSHFDSRPLSTFYNYDAPINFGKMVAKIWSSSNRFSPKVLTELTIGSGNYYEIDGSMYTWQLSGDDKRLYRIEEFVETGNATPGLANQEFRIVLDKGWMHEPDVIQAEDNRFNLRIIGMPEMLSPGKWLYRVTMQSSDPNSWIPPTEISVGRTFKKISTMVADSGNRKRGTTQFQTNLELQSQLGHYAEQFSVDDKVVRRELQRRKKGDFSRRPKMMNGEYTGYGALSGYQAAFTIQGRNGQSVPSGAFISYMEADVNERIEEGREMMMVFGNTSTHHLDYTGQHVIRTGPGFRELVKDGHEFYHNGSLTAQQLQDYFMQLFIYRKSESDRDIVVDTGTLGAEFFHLLVNEEASSFLTVDNHWIRQMPGGENWELEYGAQYKSFQSRHGVRVRLKMNPCKDDPNICRRFHPDNPQYTVDSARMDIYDFGSNGDSPAPGNSNMSMVMERGTEAYYWISDLIHPYEGIVNDGRRVSTDEKGVTVVRESSGSLVVWDTSRIGAMIYEPSIS